MKKYVDEINIWEELTFVEAENLSDVMEMMEIQEYFNGWRNINGGFAECELVDIDFDIAQFNLVYGQQDVGGGSVTYVDNITIDRSVLLDSGLDTQARIAKTY